MANGVIQNILDSSITSYGNETSGTSRLTLLSCHKIKHGHLVFLSARLQATSAITDAMNVPLLTLSEYPPKYDATDYLYVPSFIRTGSSFGASLAAIKTTGSIRYVHERLTSNIASGDTVEFFIVYEAN